MKCCGREMWSIYNSQLRCVIAGGCRLCGHIEMAHGCDDLVPWAISEWRKYEAVFQGKGQGSIPVRRKKPAPKVVGTKVCKTCEGERPISEFRVDTRSPSKRTYNSCRACECVKNRARKQRAAAEKKKGEQNATDCHRTA